MLCRDDIIRVWDVNVCADELCACILAEFQQLSMNTTIGEAGMFSDISHNFEIVLGYKGLNETVITHQSSKYFNTLGREHVPREMVSNICKVRIGVEEMFCALEHMVCRGPLSEDLCLADIEIEVSILFENGRQHGNELQGCR